MGKVAIVGVEGSGKTVLMGALCECYKQGAEDEPYLMPENQAAFMFMERIPHRMRLEREWPEATSVDALRTLRWTLRIGAQVLEEIEMLDYPGELYRIAFGERTKEEADAHRDELNEFLEHVTGADTLIVLLNIMDTMNLGANPRNAETVWITRGIFDYAKKIPNIKRTTLMFTQADRFEATLQAVGGAQALYAKQLPMMRMLYPDLNVIAISAVDGMDGEGRPAEGYSVEGCREVMRVIVERENAAADEAMQKCERLANRIKKLNAGSVADFPWLVGEYRLAVEEFEKAAESAQGHYWRARKQMRDRLQVYENLRADVNACFKAHGARELAENADCWQEILQKYNGIDGFIAAYRKYYAGAARDYIIGFVVMGVIITIFVLLVVVAAVFN